MTNSDPELTTGVCVTTSNCASAGGSTINNACPEDPSNVKCCSKPDCSNGSNGNCRWISDCAGSTVSNQCPGPSAFKCCSSASRGFGGYSRPALPGGICKTAAINGARAVLDAFPGRVRQLICGKSGCACGSGNDHCCGLAVDFLVSDLNGSPSMSGTEIAKWIMRNNVRLNVKFINWGQRIWNANFFDPVESWTGWRTMEDSGSINLNHW